MRDLITDKSDPRLTSRGIFDPMDIKKINGNELNGSKNGKGWEKCSHPISNDEVWLTPGERRLLGVVTGEVSRCPACGGSQNMHLGALGDREYERCRDCGMVFVNGRAISV